MKVYRRKKIIPSKEKDKEGTKSKFFYDTKTGKKKWIVQIKNDNTKGEKP